MPVFALPAASEKVSARLWQGFSWTQVLAGCCDPGLWGWISCRSGGCVQGTGARWASSGTQTPHHPGAGHQSGSVKPPETPTVWDWRNCQGDSPLVVLGRPRRPPLGPATTAKQVPSVARSTEPSPPSKRGRLRSLPVAVAANRWMLRSLRCNSLATSLAERIGPNSSTLRARVRCDCRSTAPGAPAAIHGPIPPPTHPSPKGPLRLCRTP